MGAFQPNQAAPISEVEELASQYAGCPATSLYKRYVVHATVMLGSLPIFAKQNVGGAALLVEESEQGSGVTCLQFAAGSWPDRLKGFNRFGAAREAVTHRGGVVTSSAYLSFMATSHEKGFSEARQAFTKPSAAQSFAIARGVSGGKGCSFELRHQTLDAKYTWCDCPAVFRELTSTRSLPQETPLPNRAGALPTFLYAVRQAVAARATEPVFYAHNGQLFRLRIQAQADDRSGQLAVSGWTARAGEHGETEFKLVSDTREALPLRIEFRPKSFLKLTLTEEASPQSPVLGSLLRSSQSVG